MLAANVAAALALAGVAQATSHVWLYDWGVSPAEVTSQDGSVEFTNNSSGPARVTATDGSFDSGPIPANGGFSVRLGTPGDHAYTATGLGTPSGGVVHVPVTSLPGLPSEPVADRIPDLQFKPPSEQDVAVDRRWGVVASPTRFLLGFKPGATVAQANAALAAVNGRIMGGLHDTGILLVEIDDGVFSGEGFCWYCDAFQTLHDDLDQLRVMPGVDFAAMSLGQTPDALPRRAEDPLEAIPHTWTWGSQPADGNWGLEYARFPQAWNLRESIDAKAPSVVTGIIDGGFYQHDDVPALHINDQVCLPGGACLPAPNSPADHGTHVAGIIGAAYDNPAGPEPPTAARSKGVSGGNPFAKIEGWSADSLAVSNPAVGGAVSLADGQLQLWDYVLRARPADLRVINYSYGGAVFVDGDGHLLQNEFGQPAWWASFPSKTCGPGPTDDSLPTALGGQDYCTPNNEDTWLREFGQVGRAAARIAKAASQGGVMIVQSAGNDGTTFCPPAEAPACTNRPILAENRNEFAWASANWTRDLHYDVAGLANPVIVAEAIGPTGALAPFSNYGGDVAAPGRWITSTVGTSSYDEMSGTSMAAPHVTALIGDLLADDPSLSLDQLRQRVVAFGRPAPVTRGINFDWRMADRTGLDQDGDGLPDYMTTPEALNPVAYRVDFDACEAGSGASPPARYSWSVDGGAVGETAACTFHYDFTAQGTYSVTLTVTAEDGSTQQTTKQVTVKDWVVLSVGDSVASGEGNPDQTISGVIGVPTWENGQCHRSAYAGPAQAARWLEMSDVHTSVSFLHLACSGARMTGDLNPDGTPKDGFDGVGGLLTPYEGIDPPSSACTDSGRSDPNACLPPQLAESKRLLGTRTPDALLLSIGANDLWFSKIVADCVKPLNECDTGTAAAIFNARVGALAGRYDQVAAKIHDLYPDLPPSHVFITEYMDPTRDETGAVNMSCLVGIRQAEADWAANTVVPGLNAEVARAASAHGWTLVDQIPQDFATHGYCSSDPWIRHIFESLGNEGAPDGAFHPNVAGHQDYAIRIADKLKQVLGVTLGTVTPPVHDAAPRLDAFASMLAGQDAARRLVDVNDVSKDGNRRVIRDLPQAADGTYAETPDTTFSTVPGQMTAPDHYIDMRDFRRFRDAYLQECAAGSGDTFCPDPSDISLDGAPDHPKKDLNFDRCTNAEPNDPNSCLTKEGVGSRFDFNGNGLIDVLGNEAVVPLTQDGQPAADRSASSLMSDLDVLRAKWSLNPHTSEGWGPDDLLNLIQSGDLEVHADGPFQDGASSVDVQVREAGGGADVGPQRTLKRGDGFAVVSVPADNTAQQFEVVTHATTDQGTSESISKPFSLKFGEDRRIDVCAGLSLKADPDRVPADGKSTAQVTATLNKCGAARDVAGRALTWTMTPSSGGAQLDLTPSTTDANGRGTARFTAGQAQTSYTIKVTADVGDGQTETAKVVVQTVPTLQITYLWRQFVNAWSEDGSTRWATSDPLLPDCTIPGVVEYCIDSSHVEITSQVPGGIQRSGTLLGSGTSWKVTESIDSSLARSQATWTLSKPDGSTEDGVRQSVWAVSDPQAYQDASVKGLDVLDKADGIHVDGIQAVGDLPYHYSLLGSLSSGNIDPVEIGSVPNAILLVPQGGGASIRFATDPSKQILFQRRADGTFEPYQSCGKVDQDLTTQPGYYVPSPSDFVPGATTIDRKTTYSGGDRPMPVGPGHLTVSYSFAAVASYTGRPATAPTLPDCTRNNPPHAEFTFAPASPEEGRMVAFTDQSTDPENDISKWEWDFGDGSSGTGANPYHMFKDNGSFAVTLTVTDANGGSNSTTHTVEVRNVPPEAEIDDAAAQVGQPLTVTYRMLDQGSIDKAQLRYTITSPNPIWPAQSGTQPADVYSVTFTGLPAGTYPLTLTVTDKDGDKATATAVAVVTAEPPTPPPPEAGPTAFATCDPNVSLDVEATKFLDLINDYRAHNGLGPVAVSPTLTHAADKHVNDMVTHNFFAHQGSDGTWPWDRAWAAGYPRNAAVGENLFHGSPTAHDALWAWRSSTAGHNENMLDPRWKAIGISRLQKTGDDWYWATEFGNVVDCPTVSNLRSLASARGNGRKVTAVKQHLGSRGGMHVVRRAFKLAHHRWRPIALRTVHANHPAHAHAAPAKRARHTRAHGQPRKLLSATAAFAYPPSAAFTVSNIEPLMGHAIDLTNRSLAADGTWVPALVDWGDGTPVEAVVAEDTVSHAYTASGQETITLTAQDAGGQQLAVTRDIYVDPLPVPALQYSGDSQGFVGKTLAVSAVARTWWAGDPLPGITLTFHIGDTNTVSAVTGADGVAHAQLDLSGLAEGQYTLFVDSTATADWSSAGTYADVNLLLNHPPTPATGGPYVVGLGNALLLDGSRSSDVDPGDGVVSWEWDLNNDGVFGDITGPTPRAISWDEVSNQVCGGSCVPNQDYALGLRVTDQRGDSTTATTTVRFVDDFALLLGGENRTIVPGASNSWAVTVVSAGGFSTPVTLTADGLPPDVTATFSVNPVPPGEVSVLTLTASPTAQVESFPITVTGTANGITHQVSDQINVAFGLIPVCTGEITGVATDAETGDPLVNQSIQLDSGYYYYGGQYTTTDANGRFVFHGVGLGYNNVPQAHSVLVVDGTYWQASAYPTVYCGGMSTVTLQAIRKQQGQLSGTVYEAVRDPVDGHIQRTTTPVPGAVVSNGSYYNYIAFNADDQGHYGGSLPLGYGNTDAGYYLTAGAGGYWTESQSVTASKSAPATADYEIVKQCYGHLAGGHVSYTDTGAPVVGHTVYVSGVGYFSTDQNGDFQVPNAVLLGYNNAPIGYYMSVQPNGLDPPGSVGSSGSSTISTCGETGPAVSLTIKPGFAAYAKLAGQITDKETGQPVAGGFVSLYAGSGYGGGTTTDATGHYAFDHVFLGYNVDSGSISVSVTKDGYYDSSGYVSAPRDQTSQLDLTVLKKQYATFTGVVRDVATQLPIPNALVTDANCAYYSRVCASTDRTGTYLQSNVPLGSQNAPVDIYATASADGYWQISQSAHLSAGQTTSLDYYLLRKCATARIVGTVVNAQNGNPIPNAQVSGGQYPVYTDAQGRFAIENIQPGYGNNPTQVYLTASASGFFSQSKLVTTFCGATITVDFGTRQSNLGTIVGTVTDADSGQPMANVFVGSEFGQTATTDAAGNYRFDGVPLADNNADKAWKVTASPTGYRVQTQTVTAQANVEVRADFSFSKLGDSPPVAQDGSMTIAEDTYNAPVSVQASDLDGDPLTYAITSYPQHGTLSGFGPDYTYTPNANYNGSDSFSYIANDGLLNSSEATVSITVTPVEDWPIAVNDQFTTPQATPLSISVASILANDIEPDGDPLTFVSVTPYYYGGSSVTWDGAGTITFTPPVTFTGYTGFYYRISDGKNHFSDGFVDVQVVPASGPPVCGDLSFTVAAGSTYTDTLACVDGEHDPIAYALVDPPAHGTVLVTADGSFSYAPDAGYLGPDQFTYKGNDGTSDSRNATVSLNVLHVNRAPIGVADTYTTPEDTTLTVDAGGGVLTNDTDADNDPLGATLLFGPSFGTLQFATDGSFSYVPGPNFNGSDSFTYAAGDGAATSQPTTVTIHVTPVEDAPVAAVDHYSATEDTTLTISAAAGVLANDSDPDGDALTASVVDAPAHGQVDLAADGSFHYLADPNYNGSDSFTYSVSDGALDTGPITVALDVAAVNDPPVARPDAYTTAEDTTLTIPVAAGVLANDSDVEGSTLTALRITGAAHGAVSLAADGSFVYAPGPNFNGRDSFTYRAFDGSALSPKITVTLTVTPVEDPPVAAFDGYTTSEGTPLVVAAPGLLENDTDPDGDPLNAVVDVPPAHGTVLVEPDGSFAYWPDPGFAGTDGFVYHANDGSLDSGPANVVLQVTPSEQPPTAQSLTLSTAEDTPLPVTLSATDPDSTVLTYQIVAGPTHGTLSGTAPDLTYTPDPNYNGPDSFVYRASDGTLESTDATVDLSVTPVDDAPTVSDVSTTTPEDTVLPVTLTGTDVESDPLTFSVISGPAHGTLSGSAPNLTYTPDPNYNGSDSFTYGASDGTLDSAPATVSITVTPVDDAPVASDVAQTTPEDTPATLTLTATDVESDPLTFAVVSGPAHGTLSGTAPDLTYTPDPNYNGPDSFTYKASDGQIDSNVATATITVTPVNDAPTATDQSVTTPEDTALPVSLTGADVENDPLAFTVVDGPSHGTLSGTAPSLTYTPDPNYNGTDSFTYTAFDGSLTSAKATVSITVTPVNDPPVASDRGVSTNEDTPLDVTLLASDIESASLSYRIVATPAHGSLAGAPPDLTYTPDPNYNGSDSFTYVASDGELDSNVATVAITVVPVNDPPVAHDVGVTTPEDTQAAVALPVSDVDGDRLTYAVVGAPGHGSLSGTAPDLTYTPDSNYNGTDSFTYKASDGIADSNVATVSITVTPVNDPPTARDRAVQTNADTPVAVTLAGSDPENDPLTFAVDTQPTHGALSGDSPNLTYTPALGFVGRDTFTYHASDGSAQSALATVTIDVQQTEPSDHPPTVTLAAAGPITEGSSITLTATAADVDSDPLTYTWSSDIGTIVADGTTASLVVDDGPALAHVQVTVSDGRGGTATDSTAVTVTNVAPTAHAQAAPNPQYWGLPVHFVGSATDPSHADTTAGLAPAWDFGDAVMSQNPTVDHAYPAPGAYHVTFAAHDKDGGAGRDALDVAVKKRESTLAYTGTTTISADSTGSLHETGDVEEEQDSARGSLGLRTLYSSGKGSVFLSARFIDPVDTPTASLAGHLLTFTFAGHTYTATTDANGVATVADIVPEAAGTVVVSFAGDQQYLASQTQAQVAYQLIFGDGGGFFAINTSDAVVGRNVTFWGSQWAGGDKLQSAPSSFKGFVALPGVTPACGTAWTSRPGNSGNPPAAVPNYLAVIATDRVTKAGSSIAGTTTHIVVVKTSPGYGPNPGHDGRGNVVAVVC